MKMKATFFAVLLFAALPLAQAVPVNITTSGGASTVAAPASDLGNFGDATVLNWIAADVATYNSLNSTTYGTPTSTGAQIGQTSGTGGNSILLDVTGFQYLFFHWGGSQLAQGGWAQLFYVGDASGSFNFDNSDITVNESPAAGGLSFYSLYNTASVPDGGSTLLMLGAAVSGLSLTVRRFKQN